MNSNLILQLFYMAIIVLMSLLITLVPIPLLKYCTQFFTLKRFGIRKIRRWNNTTDTLSNLFLWMSLLLCIFFGIIPGFQFIYLIWLLFTWLCAIARGVRLRYKPNWEKLTVLFFYTILVGIGVVSSFGLMDDGQLLKTSMQFVHDLTSGTAKDLLYYVTSPYSVCYIIQTLVLFLPLFILWGNFKYIRLEGTYKGRNIWTFSIRMSIWIAIFYFLAFGALNYVTQLYHLNV